VTKPSVQVAVPSFGIFILLCGLPAGIIWPDRGDAASRVLRARLGCYTARVLCSCFGSA
jgi:hypothetical protein